MSKPIPVSNITETKSNTPVTPPRLRKGYSKSGTDEDEGKDTNPPEGDVELAIPTANTENHMHHQENDKKHKSTTNKRPVSKPGEKMAVTKGDGSGNKRGADTGERKSTAHRFKGLYPLQYALWAHFLSYGAAAISLVLGIFSMVWTNAQTYECKIDGDLINDIYLLNAQGTCNATYVRNGNTQYICCDPDSKSDLKGYFAIGAVYVVYSILTFLFENVDFGWGLYHPNDSCWYSLRISPLGITHIVLGGIGLYNYVTCLGGACFLTAGIAYVRAAYRQESGDGGREAARRSAAQKKKSTENEESCSQQCSSTMSYVLSFNPYTFSRRIYNEDKLSSYVWIGLYIAANIILFGYTLDFWYNLVDDMRDDLLQGTMKIDCSDRLCHYNRKAVRYGPFSLFAPWAKGFGTCLNMNCALLLFPVVKMLLRKLNNYGVSFHVNQQQNDFCAKAFARPLTRYIPLSKNIEFHKICAMVVFFFSWGHLLFHLLNLYEANNATLTFFRAWGWDGSDLFTGALVTYAMLIIYAGAPEIVRQSKFELFFRSHHMFIVFFLVMFLHGPNFFYWTCIPVLLYLLERYMQTQRGNRPYQVLKVEWIPPVMALYIRPVFKEDFQFKEGEYLYLNCPAISDGEWHPFTISSAIDDLNVNSVRIHLETGEEVVEVPRPKNLPSNVKWSKYVLISQDYTTMDPNEYLDRSETGFFDYISLHIKVHGLDEAYARSWTRKLKEYFELLSPSRKFPFYFYRRDERGEIQMGRQFGPDGKTPILRVDGPHAAPAEHYASYGTLMLVGAGIGLTPCVSILTSLTKYRWKKNFNPELLHFYWVVRQNEVDSFQWLVHLLTDMAYDLKVARANNQIERRYYCEINIYVTAVEKDRKEVKSLYRPAKKRQYLSIGHHNEKVTPTFTAEDLYAKMLNPTVESKGQMKKMKEGGVNAENRLQDIWIWNGRPNWDEIFREMKDQRQHSDIGVCFCGAPAIGADLTTMCEKYSNAEEDCIFSLHKENF
ncbi:hypothetical protein EON65_09455 [archaeon]|nr:MAG: hypothetical protein EON65_09455 [archaeon]